MLFDFSVTAISDFCEWIAPTDLPASDARTDFTRDIVLSEHSAGSPERTSRSSEMGFIADEVLQLKDVSIGRFKTESWYASSSQIRERTFCTSAEISVSLIYLSKSRLFAKLRRSSASAVSIPPANSFAWSSVSAHMGRDESPAAPDDASGDSSTSITTLSFTWFLSYFSWESRSAHP